MKTQVLQLVGAALLVAVSAHAQISQRLTANVPFSFSAGTTMLPAGEYSVSSMSTPGVLGIQSADHKSKAVVMAISAQSSEKPGQARLVFKRYGDQYFLSHVWPAFGGIGREIPPSAREREAALSAAASADVVVVARAERR